MNSNYYETWHPDEDGTEDIMEIGHQAQWQSYFATLPKEEIVGKSVLDFGCNQGGMLRHLHKAMPFAKATGVDLGVRPIEIANERKGNLPITYVTTDDIKTLNETFDTAISHAVIYLVRDLPDHAKSMKAVLKPGGSYYATYSDYNGSTLLPEIYKYVKESASIAMDVYTIPDFISAFENEGFSVGIQRIPPIGFIPISVKDSWTPEVQELIRTTYESTYVMRFTNS